ncbi:SDR family oxidoreductase [Williamsia sp. CHRR-6]|uniref:SDR family NAD(P)-dependent oxidoreductase n=1 Tax=Williamsia sp. CHRR-6 TaxID=2835871 RepID=UPI001BD92874|nr:SDR family oxidoreductase [Williamsia sp. CHRR-6]MBT0567082.1 SDR family oxidoreductase [Williamsia sp. CHRR-6]
MNKFTGKVAVVTGAGSGIGRALAVGLAQRGARLALADVDEAGLTETVKALPHTEVMTAKVDVSDRHSVADFAREVKQRFGVVHQVYNNAGIAPIYQTVLEQDYRDYERTFAVNLWGTIHGTKEFLPHLIESGDGHVVNISSLNGIMAESGIGPYATTKFAVRGFTETLRVEMLKDKLPVKVSIVHPGGVKTNISRESHVEGVSAEEARRAKIYEEQLYTWTPAQAAERILTDVARGKGRICFAQTRWVDPMVRLFPSSYPRLAVWLEKRFFGS